MICQRETKRNPNQGIIDNLNDTLIDLKEKGRNIKYKLYYPSLLKKQGLSLSKQRLQDMGMLCIFLINQAISYITKLRFGVHRGFLIRIFTLMMVLLLI